MDKKALNPYLLSVIESSFFNFIEFKSCPYSLNYFNSALQPIGSNEVAKILPEKYFFIDLKELASIG